MYILVRDIVKNVSPLNFPRNLHTFLPPVLIVLMEWVYWNRVEAVC